MKNILTDEELRELRRMVDAEFAFQSKNRHPSPGFGLAIIRPLRRLLDEIEAKRKVKPRRNPKPDKINVAECRLRLAKLRLYDLAKDFLRERSWTLEEILDRRLRSRRQSEVRHAFFYWLTAEMKLSLLDAQWVTGFDYTSIAYGAKMHATKENPRMRVHIE
jgi:hypothetical protein